MERPHDVGGLEGYGAITTADEREPFNHEWEARVFALNRILLKQGLYTLDEFRNAIETMPPHAYHHASYYERWLHAIEMLLVQNGVLDA